MVRQIKTCAFLVLVALLLAPWTGERGAVAATRITEVKISDDLKRVMVKADGPLNSMGIARLESPSRLAIQVPETSLGDVDHTIRNPDNGALLVKVAPSGSGVKLVLDFGKIPVPDHKMKFMDNCLIVLLGSSRAQTGAETPSFSSAAGASGSKPAGDAPLSQNRVRAESKEQGDVSVCSAEVVDGSVVVVVASKKRQGRKYRIKLGLNLDDLGFQSATIARVHERAEHPQRVTSATSSPAPAKRRVGPKQAAASRDLTETKIRDKPVLSRLQERWKNQQASRMPHLSQGTRKRAEPGCSAASGEQRDKSAPRVARQ
jgi:hypothetical protein